VSGAALGLVLLAGLVHATWNLAAKRAAGGVAFSALSATFAAVLWAPVGIPVLLGEAPGWSGAQWAAVSGSAVLHVAYFAALLRGYQVGDLSVVYPVARGTGPLLTVVAAVMFRGERPGPLGFAGVVAIIGGVVLIATGGRFRRSAKLAAGLGYGLLTGVTIAAYTLLDGHSVKDLGVSPIGLDYGSNLVRVVLTIPIAVVALRKSGHAVRGFAQQHAKLAAVVGLLSPLAYVLVLQAAKTSDLSQVAPAREVSMLFAALFAGTLLDEEGLVTRLAGAGLIAVGVIAIALS
jgi:drug/metabolite transporter (DMT)-like permease